MKIHKRETRRETRRKHLNENLTGLRTERKEGLSPGCLPPSSKTDREWWGNFPEEERSRARDGTLLRVSKQESRFTLQRNKGERGPGWVQGGRAGQMWDRTRTFAALCEPGQLARNMASC